MGLVEEITLTYVVVKVWDLRRLVVPITHFLEKPFQNWSKVSPEILGTAERQRGLHRGRGRVPRGVGRILASEEGKKLWDGKVKGIQARGFERPGDDLAPADRAPRTPALPGTCAASSGSGC